MLFLVSYFTNICMHIYDLYIYILITAVVARPASSTVVALNDVTLTCSPISISSSVTYSWHRVDGDLPSSSTGQDTNRLTIHRVVPADEGQYYCLGTAFGHCAVSDNVIVIVEGTRKLYHI